MAVLVTRSGFFVSKSWEIFLLCLASKMALPAKTVRIATTYCLFLVPSLIFGRPSLIPSLNSRRPSLSLLDYGSSENAYSSKSVEDVLSEIPPTKECNCKCQKTVDDSLNDVELSIPSSTSAPKTAKLRQPLPIHNIPYQLKPTSCIPRSRKSSIRPSMDTYPIGDIKFEIDTRRTHGNTNTTVIAECDFLVGLDNFQKRKWDVSDYILTWRKLKTRCPVSIVTGGMKEGQGEVAIQVEQLFMQVKMSPSDLRKGKDLNPLSVETQLSEVRKASVEILDLEDWSDYARAISSQIEKTVLCIVNSEIRNVLKDSLKCFREGSSTSCRLTS